MNHVVFHIFRRIFCLRGTRRDNEFMGIPLKWDFVAEKQAPRFILELKQQRIGSISISLFPQNKVINYVHYHEKP